MTKRLGAWSVVLGLLLLTAPLAGQSGGGETAKLNAALGRAGSAIEAQAAPDAAPDAGKHIVFGHYMTCYFNSLDFYKQEIELAQRHGLDGFALNCGNWDKNYMSAAERIYEAAKQMDSGFQLVMSPDHNTGALPDMVERFYEHPNQFRWNGKAVMSSYGGDPGMWAGAVQKAREAGHDFLFVPSGHLMPNWKMAWSYEGALGLFTNHPHVDGTFYFAIDGTANDLIRSNAVGRRVAQHLGKIYMAGCGPAYNSANLRDFQGMRGYGAQWEGIIRDRPEWVEIVTWSDYNEDSALMPFRWQRDWQKQYYDHDEAYLDMTQYYVKWYKSRARPPIVQDKVYYAYRNRSQWLRKVWDPKKEQWVDITLADWPFDQMHDDVQDKVYATTVLTAPAELTIELAGKAHTFQQPAGIAHVDIPLTGGTPAFTLKRDGKELTAFRGRKQILDESTQTKENSWKSYHLANRTWTGGSAVGPVVAALEAESGTLLGDAKVVAVGAAKGVQNVASDGSGFEVPVKGLKTATYAVRVRYSNPTDTEARLTLVADGPPRGEKEYPYYIPLFLPPTGEGKLETTSFLWSLYDATTFLRAVWMQNVEKGANADHPLSADQGTPIIDRIELVKVEPTPMPQRPQTVFPEMVAIPGGSFTMGSKDGNPDEGPEHKVTLAPFAIGKYEVTNEEFERFDPAHRQFRDGFSWRDREPVIYVKWTDAVNYCNWLSEQAGLTPAYVFTETEVQQGKKTVMRKAMTFDPAAEGFRLPSEAEWEYVASGRGEERTFPWGNDEPVPGVHGNFPGPQELVPNANVPSSAERGTMVVGTYPAGASRDGVMDLAGNVCEWCNDWLQPYTAEAKTNPHVQTESPYRAIRGSSFGYYGAPVRVSDREYNNPNYGGYVYIGFRVVLPEKGMRKLAK